MNEKGGGREDANSTRLFAGGERERRRRRRENARPLYCSYSSRAGGSQRLISPDASFARKVASRPPLLLCSSSTCTMRNANFHP